MIIWSELIDFWQIVGISIVIMFPLAWVAAKKPPPEE